MIDGANWESHRPITKYPMSAQQEGGSDRPSPPERPIAEERKNVPLGLGTQWEGFGWTLGAIITRAILRLRPNWKTLNGVDLFDVNVRVSGSVTDSVAQEKGPPGSMLGPLMEST